MNRALGMIGLAARARKIVSGEEMTVKAVRNGTAAVALLDAEAGPNTKKSVSDSCRFYEVPLVELPAGELGSAIGRSGRMACAVLDQGMAKRIIELTKTDESAGVKPK